MSFHTISMAQYILQMPCVEMELAESPQVFRDSIGMAKRKGGKRRACQVGGEAPHLAHSKQPGMCGSDQCLKATGSDGKFLQHAASLYTEVYNNQKL